MRDPSPPPAFRQRLLPTDPESLPPGIADAVGKLCRESAGVAAAFLCRVLVEAEGCDPITRLELGVKLSLPILAPTDIDHSVAGRISAGLARDAAFAGQVRLALLADRAVHAWASHGVRVFPMSE